MSEKIDEFGTLLNKAWAINRIDSAQKNVDALAGYGKHLLSGQTISKLLEVGLKLASIQNQINQLVD